MQNVAHLHPGQALPARAGTSDGPRAVTGRLAALTARMARGDEDAWRVFHARYHDRLLRYLLVLTRDDTAARDALQQTLTRVVRHVRRFDDEAVFWSWLTVLARSAAADEGRRHRRYFAFLARLFEQAPADGSDEGDMDAALIEILEANLSALDAGERELIEWKYFRGETVRAIAAALATSEGAVESRLARVRCKLKAAVLRQLHHENQS